MINISQILSAECGGIGIEEIAEDYIASHSQAFDPLGLEVDLTLNSVGSTN